MAFETRATTLRRLALVAALGMRLAGAPASVNLSLEEASARKPPDSEPVNAGKTVSVKGVVSIRPISFLQYDHLPIQDSSYGLTLEGPVASFDRYNPGDELQVTGKIGSRAGLVVLQAPEIRVLFHGAAPAPKAYPAEALRSTRVLGQLVTTSGRVTDIGESTGGAYLILGESGSSYRVFVPYSQQTPRAMFANINIGDRVQATGVASQYCPLPPFDRWFELVTPSSAGVVRIAKGWLVPPLAFGGVLALGLFFGVVWWSRERRLNSQREVLSAAHELGEEVLGLTSRADILKRISAVLPRIFHVSRVRLYVYNRGGKTLDEVQATPKGQPVAISLEAPGGGTQPGAVACFHNRTQLVVPDSSRSPFAVVDAAGPPIPRSLLFLPMFAQGDVIGVIEIGHDKGGRVFSVSEQTLAQHLANQIGLAIQLVGQQSVREQLFRTEKLAAVGRLISGVVNELQVPLATISKMAHSVLAEEPYSPVERELQVIASEAGKASDIVTRLVSFAGGEQMEAKPVDLNRLLRSLIQFREREWKVRGIRVHNLLIDRPLTVMGSQGQLEQVFLNLLVHAEQSMAEASDKVIVLRTSVLAGRVLIEIGYRRAGEPAESEDPFSKWSESSAGALGLGVCRSILAGHSGEVRLVHGHGSESRFEIELPWAGEAGPARLAEVGRDRSKIRTALLLEPDEPVQRQLLTMLSSRGYRVVPAQNSEIGLDLAQRLRFNIVFCSIRLPGLNWVDLSERFQPLVDAFVLVSEAYDPDLVINFERARRFVLSKPIDEVQLDRVLAFAENPPSRRELIAG